MAEILVLEPIKEEISSIMSAGSSLAEDASALAGAPNMQCAKKFEEQQEEIAKLIKLYQRLVEKDAAEINDVVDNFFAVDESM